MKAKPILKKNSSETPQGRAETDRTPPPRHAIFGGTFDPPHLGHLKMAILARKAFQLDHVHWVPCRVSPFKTSNPPSSGELRTQMLEALIRKRPWSSVSTIELQREPPSYAWQTGQWFEQQIKGAEWFWILGADQWALIRSWARTDLLSRQFTFIVFTREGKCSIQPGFRHRILPLQCKISSSEIRRRLRLGQPVSHLVPPPVYRVLKRLKLVRPGQTHDQAVLNSDPVLQEKN